MGLNYIVVDYLDSSSKHFDGLYRAQCHCGTVVYDVRTEPLDAKICHCFDCQSIHGAPMQWAAIFAKEDVRFLKGVDQLTFYHAPSQQPVHTLPCKVGCGLCGSWIADEGRRMWLAFPSLFLFKDADDVPASFRPTCHIFYGQRRMNIDDHLPKWSGHKGKSEQIG